MRRRYLYIAVAILAFAMLPSAHAQTWYLGEIRFVAFNFARRLGSLQRADLRH